MSGILFDWGRKKNDCQVDSKCLPELENTTAEDARGVHFECFEQFSFSWASRVYFGALWPHPSKTSLLSPFFSHLATHRDVYLHIRSFSALFPSCKAKVPLSFQLLQMIEIYCRIFCKKQKKACVISIRRVDLQKIHNSNLLYLEISTVADGSALAFTLPLSSRVCAIWRTSACVMQWRGHDLYTWNKNKIKKK